MRIVALTVLAGLCISEAFAAPSSHGGNTRSPGLLVETSSGPIHGFVNRTLPDVRQFLGIPFAEPPINNLRFAKPETKKPGGAVKAFRLPNSCMQQLSTNSSTIYTTYEKGFLISGGNSEDCLYLSIWAPRLENIRLQQRPLPVLLYIPGGGFTSGGQASLYKIPDQWVQRTQSHLVVVREGKIAKIVSLLSPKATTKEREQRSKDPKPLIIGSNTNEGAGFVSFTPNGPGQVALDKATRIISCPVAAEVKNRNTGGLSTYRYQYAGNFSNVSPLPWFGAYHSAELPLLFGTHSEYGGPSTSFE